MSFLYTVQFGDTLLSIAQRFGTTLPILAQMNNISCPYIIYIGQRLIIPEEIHSQQISGVAPNYSLEGNNYTPAFGYVNQDPITIDQESVEKIVF